MSDPYALLLHPSSGSDRPPCEYKCHGVDQAVSGDRVQSIDAAKLGVTGNRFLRSAKVYDDVDGDDDLDDDLDNDEIDADEEERAKPLFGASVFDKALKSQKKMDKYIDRLMANNVGKARLARELDLDPNAMSAWEHKYRNIYLQLAKRLE